MPQISNSMGPPTRGLIGRTKPALDGSLLPACAALEYEGMSGLEAFGARNGSPHPAACSNIAAKYTKASSPGKVYRAGYPNHLHQIPSCKKLWGTACQDDLPDLSKPKSFRDQAHESTAHSLCQHDQPDLSISMPNDDQKGHTSQEPSLNERAHSGVQMQSRTTSCGIDRTADIPAPAVEWDDITMEGSLAEAIVCCDTPTQHATAPSAVKAEAAQLPLGPHQDADLLDVIHSLLLELSNSLRSTTADAELSTFSTAPAEVAAPHAVLPDGVTYAKKSMREASCTSMDTSLCKCPPTDSTYSSGIGVDYAVQQAGRGSDRVWAADGSMNQDEIHSNSSTASVLHVAASRAVAAADASASRDKGAPPAESCPVLRAWQGLPLQLPARQGFRPLPPDVPTNLPRLSLVPPMSPSNTQQLAADGCPPGGTDNGNAPYTPAAQGVDCSELLASDQVQSGGCVRTEAEAAAFFHCCAPGAVAAAGMVFMDAPQCFMAVPETLPEPCDDDNNGDRVAECVTPIPEVLPGLCGGDDDDDTVAECCTAVSEALLPEPCISDSDDDKVAECCTAVPEAMLPEPCISEDDTDKVAKCCTAVPEALSEQSSSDGDDDEVPQCCASVPEVLLPEPSSSGGDDDLAAEEKDVPSQAATCQLRTMLVSIVPNSVMAAACAQPVEHMAPESGLNVSQIVEASPPVVPNPDEDVLLEAGDVISGHQHCIHVPVEPRNVPGVEHGSSPALLLGSDTVTVFTENTRQVLEEPGDQMQTGQIESSVAACLLAEAHAAALHASGTGNACPVAADHEEHTTYASGCSRHVAQPSDNPAATCQSGAKVQNTAAMTCPYPASLQDAANGHGFTTCPHLPTAPSNGPVICPGASHVQSFGTDMPPEAPSYEPLTHPLQPEVHSNGTTTCCSPPEVQSDCSVESAVSRMLHLELEVVGEQLSMEVQQHKAAEKKLGRELDHKRCQVRRLQRRERLLQRALAAKAGTKSPAMTPGLNKLVESCDIAEARARYWRSEHAAGLEMLQQLAATQEKHRRLMLQRVAVLEGAAITAANHQAETERQQKAAEQRAAQLQGRLEEAERRLTQAQQCRDGQDEQLEHTKSLLGQTQRELAEVQECRRAAEEQRVQLGKRLQHTQQRLEETEECRQAAEARLAQVEERNIALSAKNASAQQRADALELFKAKLEEHWLTAAEHAAELADKLSRAEERVARLEDVGEQLLAQVLPREAAEALAPALALHTAPCTPPAVEARTAVQSSRAMGSAAASNADGLRNGRSADGAAATADKLSSSTGSGLASGRDDNGRHGTKRAASTASSDVMKKPADLPTLQDCQEESCTHRDSSSRRHDSSRSGHRKRTHHHKGSRPDKRRRHDNTSPQHTAMHSGMEELEEGEIAQHTQHARPTPSLPSTQLEPQHAQHARSTLQTPPMQSTQTQAQHAQHPQSTPPMQPTLVEAQHTEHSHPASTQHARSTPPTPPTQLDAHHAQHDHPTPADQPPQHAPLELQQAVQRIQDLEGERSALALVQEQLMQLLEDAQKAAADTCCCTGVRTCEQRERLLRKHKVHVELLEDEASTLLELLGDCQIRLRQLEQQQQQ